MTSNTKIILGLLAAAAAGAAAALDQRRAADGARRRRHRRRAGGGRRRLAGPGDGAGVGRCRRPGRGDDRDRGLGQGPGRRCVPGPVETCGSFESSANRSGWPSVFKLIAGNDLTRRPPGRAPREG